MLRDRYHRFLSKRLVFDDERGEKPWWASRTRAKAHIVEQAQLKIPGWCLPPLKIIVLADLHVGSHAGDLNRFAGIVDEVNALKPDLIAMPGDFVNMMPLGGGRVPPERVALGLSELKARYGMIAVLGNHDNELSAERVGDALRAVGVVVLDNAVEHVAVGEDKLTILGLTDARSASPDHDRLTAMNFGSGGVVLTHDPASFAYMPKEAAVMICGHTHGGQICLPGRRALINMSTAPLRWTAGHIEEDGRHLYVSRGLGTSTLPFRTYAPPEISVLTITGSGT